MPVKRYQGPAEAVFIRFEDALINGKIYFFRCIQNLLHRPIFEAGDQVSFHEAVGADDDSDEFTEGDGIIILPSSSCPIFHWPKSVVLSISSRRAKQRCHCSGCYALGKSFVSYF
jgi:hypothetical protein